MRTFVLLIFFTSVLFSDDDQSNISFGLIPTAEVLHFDSAQAVSIILGKYHKVPLNSLDDLKKRKELLEQLIQLGDIKNLSQSDQKKLTKLKSLAKRKSKYLEGILELYNQKSPFEIFSSQEGGLQLVNRVSYDLNIPTHWGLFWLEALDPCHRLSLTEHYLQWQNLHIDIPFFVWLERQSLPHEMIKVSYLSEEELASHILYIKGGTLRFRKNDKPATLGDDAECLYAILPNFTLIAITASNTIRHTSITSGKPVLAAGSLVIEQGSLRYIDTESGHYQPKLEHLLKAIEILESQGLIVNKDALDIKWYDEQGKTKKMKLSKVNQENKKTSSIAKNNMKNGNFRFKI